MTLFEERLTFLNDTVVFYGKNTDLRAVDMHGNGSYINSDGLCCAIGRHIPPEKRTVYLNGNIERLYLYDPKTNTGNKVDIADYLPEKVLKLGTKFLSAVSILHDSGEFWFDGSLSYSGQRFYNRIVRTFCSNDFHTNYETDYLN